MLKSYQAGICGMRWVASPRDDVTQVLQYALRPINGGAVDWFDVPTEVDAHPAPTTAQEAEPARKKALEDAIKACENEYLCEPNPNYEDRAYDQGVRDCVNALRAIITNEREATQEGGQAKGVDRG